MPKPKTAPAPAKPPEKVRQPNPAQLVFAMAYIEQGFAKIEQAYLKAYPGSATWKSQDRASQGHKVLKSKAVAPIIAQARERSNITLVGAFARAAMSKAEVLTDLGELFKEAKKDKNYTGATKVGELMAKLQGWITERRDVRVIRSIEDLTDEELDVLIAGRSPAIAGAAEPATGGPVTPSVPVPRKP